MSLCWTTTGAVAVRPVEPVTCTVPWPADSATITPFWSTLAMSGRREFHVTATIDAGELCSRRARRLMRVVFDERRKMLVGLSQQIATRPGTRTLLANRAALA